MKVFKFGGASVNSAEGVKNVAKILRSHTNEKLLVVISAMGKTTNMLENLLHAFLEKSPNKDIFFNQVKLFHSGILNILFTNTNDLIYEWMETKFEELWKAVNKPDPSFYDFEYDQIVSFGEIFSTQIVSHYLKGQNIGVELLDVRSIIRTDDNYREAAVNWPKTEQNVREKLTPLFEHFDIIITQGFIGGTPQENTTTLGREGSDYSAAIFAYCLNASEMVIWKDVSGLFNADPKMFSKAQKFEQIPYKEAIELAYYGATVIHPKTIKPLENKQIPLYVKSFLSPDEKGTVISDANIIEPQIPSYIFKNKQILLSISAKDFSFIAEDNLFEIFEIFARLGVKINVMQNSAISFSVCMDENKQKFGILENELQKKFHIKYNSNLELITIRHYTQEIIERVVQDKMILLEQRSRLTAQIVVK